MAKPIKKKTTSSKASMVKYKPSKIKAVYFTNKEVFGHEQLNIQITNSNLGAISMLPAIFKYGSSLFSAKNHANDKRAQDFRVLCKNIYRELNKQLKPINWQAKKQKPI